MYKHIALYTFTVTSILHCLHLQVQAHCTVYIYRYKHIALFTLTGTSILHCLYLQEQAYCTVHKQIDAVGLHYQDFVQGLRNVLYMV